MIIDISRPIHAGMAVYPGNPPVAVQNVQTATNGESALSVISFGSHTGTHIDAPSHIIDGAPGVDMYNLEQMIGQAEVVDVSNVKTVITATDLPLTTSSRALLKTSNSNQDINSFSPDFVALDESAAKELVSRGVRLVGIDALSIKKKGVRDNVHKILLDAGIIILEGLWFNGVESGSYHLMCLPLPVINCDGAPVRAVLML